MKRFNIIAFTHAGIGLKKLGQFHLEKEAISAKMNALKKGLDLSEIMYLSTCNRVEFIFVSPVELPQNFVNAFVHQFNMEWDQTTVDSIAKKARTWNGINAVNHLIEVASSLDSMVLGEREIIAQVRNAYDFAHKNALSGDTLRVIIRHTIETAKKVYTDTSIAEKSVSVVALAYRELMKKSIPLNARILIIGSGITNQNMCKFFDADGYRNFMVFNRTLENAEKLASTYGCEGKALKELPAYKNGFDVIVTCTGAANAVLTKTIYTTILPDARPKHIIDLAIPNDVEPSICNAFSVNYISVETLKKTTDKNLLARRKELLKARQIIFEALEEFKVIFEMRQIEIKMRAIPDHVKKIRHTAITEVFSKEIMEMDEKSKEVLDKVLNYMEKKYVSVPMIMAKNMLVKK
ncbi:MAG: glutamyl-tRNA reductase [Crocinitomix sp.]|nr:glutamyl-tRNA reductase [Crocinitomix sp.]